MKTKFRIKRLPKNFFSILLIAFHIHLVLCRPSVNNHVDAGSSSELQDAVVSSPSDGRGRHSQVRRPVYDLRNVGPTEIYYTMRGDRRLLKNNDTLILYSDHKDFVSFVSSSSSNADVDDDTPTGEDDAIDDVVLSDREGSRRHHQVADRNLVRKRRQGGPEPHKPHRRRRKKHRLVLKARDRNHLSENGAEDLKDRRGRFLIKSDSPGYVITSASEVKKDWCRTIPLRQKVSEPHCRSKVVQNNFCYGQCNSFFIPHTGRTDNKVAFQSCAFCKPFRQRWGNVTLNCPGRNPPKIEKTVLFVETCRCITEVFQ